MVENKTDEEYKRAVEHRLTRLETLLWVVCAEVSIILPILLYLMTGLH